MQAERSGPDPLLQPEEDVKPFSNYEAKGDMYARGSAYYQLLSSGGLCALYATFYSPPVVELLRPVTGWDLDWAEGLTIGRRILTLRQAFDAREGIKPSDFRYPKRFETPLAVGPGAGKEIPFEQLREHYFKAMGWDPGTGAPSEQTLRRARDRSAHTEVVEQLSDPRAELFCGIGDGCPSRA